MSGTNNFRRRETNITAISKALSVVIMSLCFLSTPVTAEEYDGDMDHFFDLAFSKRHGMGINEKIRKFNKNISISIIGEIDINLIDEYSDFIFSIDNNIRHSINNIITGNKTYGDITIFTDDDDLKGIAEDHSDFISDFFDVRKGHSYALAALQRFFGDYENCQVRIEFDNEDIDKSIIIIRSGVSYEKTRSCLFVGTIQSVGLLGFRREHAPIIYRMNKNNLVLSKDAKNIFQLLYDNRIKSGMDREEVLKNLNRSF